MNIIYNNQKDFTSSISNFFYKCDKNFRKTQINIIPSIILGMILSESPDFCSLFKFKLTVKPYIIRFLLCQVFAIYVL